MELSTPGGHETDDSGAPLNIHEGAGSPLTSHGAAVRRVLETRGALFTQELSRATAMLPSHFEMGMSELIGHGMITCDSFGGLRRLLKPASKRPRRAGTQLLAAGRWSLLRHGQAAATSDAGRADGDAAATGTPGTADARAEFVARRLLERYGIVFRRMLTREKIPISWRDIVRVYRHLELKGEVRGGRFVAGFAGEQYASPGAVEMLRRVRKQEPSAPLTVSASDPLNLQGILTPDERVPSMTRRKVQVG